MENFYAAFIEQLCALDDLVLLEGDQERTGWDGMKQRGLVLALPLRQQGLW